MADHRYRVIKRLEAGGMAEVYLGEATGVEGFKKRVAIKRVLPHLAQNENFIRMFLDEARLSARLTHANIVSVFDISAREETYFLIMEFVDGANLKKIQECLQRRGQRFALPEAVYVCAEACRGLSYAHELHDENGRPLGIVHRDISPPNIMLSKLGEIKVADFGLAKAGTQLSQTDPGVVKGKFSYLSPEAANGKEVDARADIFSLGIVLWEMLAGRRLFLGETDYATVKLVQQANIPRLSPLNNQVDVDFEEIMLTALSRDPEKRFQSAQEFANALTGYLFHRQLKVTNFDIARLVKGAIAEDSLPVKSEASLIDRLIQEELDESVDLRGDVKEPPTTPLPGHASQPPDDTGFEDPSQWFNEDEAAKTNSSRRPPADPRPANAATTGWRETGIEPADLEDDDDETGQHLTSASLQPLSLEPDPPSRPPRPDVPSSSGAPSTGGAAASAVAKRPAFAGKYVVMAMAVLVVLVVAFALLGRYTF
jgi:serine/threonine-protein kinase